MGQIKNIKLHIVTDIKRFLKKMFLDLLTELQFQVMSYCTTRDLVNLACTSSQYHAVVQQVVSHTVRIPTSQLHNSGFRCQRKLAKKIEQLKMTKVIRLTSPHIWLSTFKAVGKLTNLTELDVRHCHTVGEKHLAALCKCLAAQLQRLDVSGTQVDEAAMKHIQLITSLEELVLSRCPITDKGCASLVPLTSLRILDISHSNCLSDNAMVHVGKLEWLVELNIRCTNIGAEGLAHLSRLCALRKLDTSDCVMIESDDALKHISRLVTLEELYLSHHCKLTNKGLLLLASLTSLWKLTARWVGGEMENVNKLISLKELCLR